LHRLPLRARLPFKYGITTLTELPHCLVRGVFEVNGRPVEGMAADHFPPKWFVKDPGQSVESEIADMARVVEAAMETATAQPAASLSDWIVDLFETQWSDASLPSPLLLRQFGASLWERAAIDAVCRATSSSLQDLLTTRALSPPERWAVAHGAGCAGGWERRPLTRLTLRHTVGMADTLRSSHPHETPDDGLPVTLEDCIRAYGLTHFKLKLSGKIEEDLDRLEDTLAVCDEACRGGFLFTLDANENFDGAAEFRGFTDRVRARPRLVEWFSRLHYIEQPLRRDIALSDAAAGIGDVWSQDVPVIIDESDGHLASFGEALRLGYRGISHKNCKGVLKSVLHREIIDRHNAAGSGRPWVMTGEDLCNIPPVALLQDLNVQAHLGNATVERNGHHYFAGLTGFPSAVGETLNVQLPELFAPSAQLGAALKVQAGELDVSGLIRQQALGLAAELNVSFG